MENQRQIRQRVCGLMNWTEQQFAEHLLGNMEHYTAFYCSNDKRLYSLLVNSGVYVNWYVKNYYKRCKIFLNCHPRLSALAVQKYNALHYYKSQKSYPNNVIINKVLKKTA